MQLQLPFTPEKAKRLSRQCESILARLQQGSATNDELIGVARKYTSRISDLRRAGYRITCTHEDQRTGLTRYELTS